MERMQVEMDLLLNAFHLVPFYFKSCDIRNPEFKVNVGFYQEDDVWQLQVDSKFTLADFYINSTSDIMNWIMETFHDKLVFSVQGFLDYASTIL